MHIWVLSWATEESDAHGPVFQHMAFADIEEAKNRGNGMVRRLIDWEPDRDSTGEVIRWRAVIEDDPASRDSRSSPAVIIRVPVYHPSSFIGQLTRAP